MVDLLLDRTTQREELQIFIAAQGEKRALRIVGEPSSGKSQFIRYAASVVEDHALLWGSGLSHHRCFRSEVEKPFGLIGELAAAIFKNYSTQTQTYLSKISKSSIANASTKLILGIAKDFLPIKNTLAGLADASPAAFRDDVVSDILGAASERQALSDHIGKLLETIRKSVRYIVVDDLHNADLDSVRVLFPIISRTPDVSLISSDAGEANGDFIDLFKDHFWTSATTLRLHRLSPEECFDIINEFSSNATEHQARQIHKITEGVFGKIAEILPNAQTHLAKFEDTPEEDLRRDFDDGSLLNIDFMSPPLEELRELFALRFLIDGELPIDLLKYTSCLGGKMRSWSSSEVGPALTRLLADITPQHVVITQGHLVFNRRFVDRIAQHFKITDDAKEIASPFANKILGAEGDRVLSQSNISHALPILINTHPNDVIAMVQRASENVKELSIEALNGLSVVAERLSHTAGASLSDAMTRLLEECHSRSLFAAGARLVDADMFPNLSNSHLVLYFDCLREDGQFRQMEAEKFNGLERALISKSSGIVERLKVINSICPALEHRGSYDAIRDHYRDLDRQIGNDHEQSVEHLKFSINRGLAEYHANLVDNLRQSIEGLSSTAIPGQDKDVLMAMASNHLGLAHYFRAEYEDALKCFRSCLLNTRELGKRTETPLNNIGAVLVLLGDFTGALRHLEEALEIDHAPIYQKWTSRLNLAVAAYKVGDESTADSILNVVDDLDSPLPDPSFVRKFAATKGFICFEREEWSEANRQYMQAVNGPYRYAGEDYKRTYSKMAELCAVKAGFLPSREMGEFDFLFTPSTKAPYEYPFAVDINSLYVF